MWTRWWPRQTLRIQYGSRDRAKDKFGPMSPEGELTEEQLRENREDMPLVTRDAANEFIDDEFYDDRMAREDYGKIEVPVLSAGNWVRPLVACIGAPLTLFTGWAEPTPERQCYQLLARRIQVQIPANPYWTS
jgi:hypothetical protein